MPAHMRKALPYPRASTWYQRIRNARARGHFTTTEKNMAMSWNRCAVGERFELKDEEGRPESSPPMGQGTLDSEDVEYILEAREVDFNAMNSLLELGGDFGEAVRSDAIRDAERLRREIAKVSNGW